MKKITFSLVAGGILVFLLAQSCLAAAPQMTRIRLTEDISPCSSAVAEIYPTEVNPDVEDQPFFYYIEPTIGEDDSGINKIEITVPSTYSDIEVWDVVVEGSLVSFTNNTSGNTISVTLATTVTTDGTDLLVSFIAHTPSATDSGVDFTSALDNTAKSVPVSCKSGDGDGGGSVISNTWTVTTFIDEPPIELPSGDGDGCFIDTTAPRARN